MLTCFIETFVNGNINVMGDGFLAFLLWLLRFGLGGLLTRPFAFGGHGQLGGFKFEVMRIEKERDVKSRRRKWMTLYQPPEARSSAGSG